MFHDLKPYDTYGNQAHAWIPAFPAAWAVTPGAGALTEVRTRNDGLRETTVLSLSYGRVVVKPTDKLHGLVPASYETYQILEPGDIVFRPTDLQNDQRSIRVGAVEDRGIITSAYIGLRPRGIDPQFAFLYLRALDYLKVFYGMGSGLRQNIDFRDFKRLPIPVPPVEEQRAIVTYLAHAHQRIDKAIATKRHLISLLAEERRAVAREVLQASSGRTVALKRFLDALIDCEHKTAPFSETGTKRIVRTAGVRDGALVMAGTYPTTDEAYDAWTQRGVPRAGDVVFTREAPAGEACVIPTGLELALGQRTVLMRPRASSLDPNYLVQQIYAGPARTAIELASQGSTVGHFNMSDIANLPIPIVDLQEQQAAIGTIKEETDRIDEAISVSRAEIGLLEEFRTRLTADVVTGQIDVRVIAASLPPIELAGVFAASTGAGDAEDDETAVEADVEDE